MQSRVLCLMVGLELLAGCGPSAGTVSRAPQQRTVEERPEYIEQHTSRGAPSVGKKKIENFELADFYGQKHALAELAEKPLVVLVFLGTECPLARLYAPKLQELAEKYAPRGVAFWAIDSNVQDSAAELREFSAAYQLNIPILRDVDNRIADRLGASRTPEAFVLDQARLVRYQGRIDDEFGFYEGTSYQRVREVRQHLASALDELLAGKPVSRAAVPAPGCRIGRAQPRKSGGPVTWCHDIAPIMQRRCQGCHRPGTTAPFSLLTYQDAMGWEDMIVEVLEAGRMPPWHANPKYGKFLNDPRLAEEEKNLIYAWVKGGAPEGNPSDLPPPRKFREPWRIKNPDLLLYISDAPIDIPASGLPHFKERLLDLNFKTDTWLNSIQCQPDNRSVVHHMDVLIAPAGDFDEHLRAGRVRRMGGYVPGIESTAAALSADQGEDADPPRQPRMLIPAGSQLLIDIHYKPNGRPQKDRSAVAIRFATPQGSDKSQTVVKEESRQPSVSAGGSGLPASPRIDRARDGADGEIVVGEQSVLIEDTNFCIRPGAANYRVVANYTFMYPSLLTSLHAHMHVRGKSMLYEAEYPDGTTEILLDVPRYDYNWELVYLLAEPKRIPQGTLVRVTTIFDNSVANPHNPDPTVPVFYGRGYYDQEMMSGTISFEPHIAGFSKDEVAVLADRTRQRPVQRSTVQKLMAGYPGPETAPSGKKSTYYLRRGRFREGLGDLPQAIADYTQAIAADSTSVPAYLARAAARVKQDQKAAAIEDYSRVIQLDSNNAAAYMGRGQIVASAEAALADLNRAIEFEPDHADALFHRGEVRQRVGDLRGALADYEAVSSKLHPGYMEAYLAQGAVLLHMGREKEARQVFEKVERLRPTMKTQVDYYLGVCLFQKRRFEEALPHFANYLTIVPENRDILHMHGMALLELHRYSAADDAFEKALHLFGDDPKTLHLAAAAKAGRAKASDSATATELWQQVTSQLKRALSIAPNYLPAGIALAEAYQIQDDPQRAVVVYREILRFKPDHAPAAMKLSWLLATEPDRSLRHGQEALRLAQQACQATGMREPSCLSALAAALAECGRFDEAVLTIDRAIELARVVKTTAQVPELQRQRALYQAKRPMRREIGPRAVG